MSPSCRHHGHERSSPTLTSSDSFHVSSSHPPLCSAVTVNVRLSSSTKCLLLNDLFVPVNSMHPLTQIFRTAMRRFPTEMARFTLRREKSVLVLCHHPRQNTSMPVHALFSALHRTTVRRLIFCVTLNVNIIRELNSRANYSLSVNAQHEIGGPYLLQHHITIQLAGFATGVTLWQHFIRHETMLRRHFVVALVSQPTIEHVVVRFSTNDTIADIASCGPQRFSFIVSAAQPYHKPTSSSEELFHDHTHPNQQEQHHAQHCHNPNRTEHRPHRVLSLPFWRHFFSNTVRADRLNNDGQQTHAQSKKK
ncbi:unnamed protein product [Agarophyton chilense]